MREASAHRSTLLWSGWAASIPIVLLATVAVEAPHARGIGFFTSLRYAIVTPLCILVTVGAAFLYRVLPEF